MSRLRNLLLWPKLKSPFTRTGGSPTDQKLDNVGNKLNIAEEYTEALFRSKSYTDLWSKIHVQLTTTTTQLETLILSHPLIHNSYTNLSNYLLEPQQDTLMNMIRTSNLHHLLIDYFRGSLEACNLCGFLLQGIHETRANYCIIQRVINLNKRLVAIDDDDQFLVIIFNKLASFVELKNPWSPSPLQYYFTVIHDRYQLMFDRLRVTRNKIEKRVKLFGMFTKGFVRLAYQQGCNDSISRLRRLHEQLDAAAKGVYILKSDFDTMGRLVTRLHDEIEHRKAIAGLCLRSQKRVMLKEVVREFQSHESCFLKQIGELEEHVYLCFLTINRARGLVLAGQNI